MIASLVPSTLLEISKSPSVSITKILIFSYFFDDELLGFKFLLEEICLDDFQAFFDAKNQNFVLMSLETFPECRFFQKITLNSPSKQLFGDIRLFSRIFLSAELEKP